MIEFRVWAPGSEKVCLHTSGSVVTMNGEAGGWWSTTLERAHPVDYAFSVDGSPPLPDPRSQWQPEGIHGRSRTVDHSAFGWTDTRWQAPPFSAAVIYELHVGTFSPEGTFDGAVERLRHLVDLGITHVELMPVAEFPGRRGWGYDGVDLFAPHHAYGGPEGLKRFVDACHQRGLAVILDVVYNHLGPVGNYLSRFGPYFTSQHRTPWGPAVNFNAAGSDEVRAFVIDNAVQWLRDYHIDALRIDAVHAILDTSAVHILEDLAVRVKTLERETGRHYALIAESDLNDPRFVTGHEAGGYGMDAQWCDDFHHALHTVLTGERGGYYSDFGGLDQLAHALACGFVYEGSYSPYRGRRHGRSARAIPPQRFVVYLGNHDQIGNRAQGDRPGAKLSIGRAKIAAALVLTSPFVPMIFQGEEWGASTPFLYFTDHDDPDVARAVSHGRRAEFAAFGWPAESVPDPQHESTFARSRLDWSELHLAPHADLLAWYRTLTRLRRWLPEIVTAPTRVECNERDGTLMVRRGSLRVACNLGETPVALPGEADQVMLLGSSEGIECKPDVLRLPPDAVALTGEASRLPAMLRSACCRERCDGLVAHKVAKPG